MTVYWMFVMPPLVVRWHLVSQWVSRFMYESKIRMNFKSSFIVFHIFNPKGIALTAFFLRIRKPSFYQVICSQTAEGLKETFRRVLEFVWWSSKQHKFSKRELYNKFKFEISLDFCRKYHETVECFTRFPMIYNILQIFTIEHHKLFSDVAIHFSQLQFFLVFLPLGNVFLVHLSMYVAVLCDSPNYSVQILETDFYNMHLLLKYTQILESAQNSFLDLQFKMITILQQKRI